MHSSFGVKCGDVFVFTCYRFSRCWTIEIGVFSRI